MRHVLLECALFAVLLSSGCRGGARDTFPTDALSDYLPHDTAAVVGLDFNDLRDRGMQDSPLGKGLRELLTKDELGLPLELLGVDPGRDLDSVRLAFAAGDTAAPLVLLRGRFDRSSFQTGKGRLEEQEQDGFRLYRHRGPVGEVTVALAGNTVVASLVRGRMIDALRHASGKAVVPIDDRLKERVRQMSRGRAVWLAANLKRLGRPTLTVAAAQLRPVFDTADSLWGGLTIDGGMRVELFLEPPAPALERHLQAVVQLIKSADELHLPLPIPSEYKPLFQLLAAAEIEKRPDVLVLHSRR